MSDVLPQIFLFITVPQLPPLLLDIVDVLSFAGMME